MTIDCRLRSEALVVAQRCLCLALLWLPLLAHGGWESLDHEAMGTRIHAEAWHADPEIARRALAEVQTEMQRIDAAFSPYREDSELSFLNREASKGWTQVSAELIRLLTASQRVSELTEGAFDVTFASAGRYYDYRRGEAPDQATLDSAVEGIDYRHIEIDAARQRVRFKHAATYVDLGGIAKGYAVDRAATIFAAAGIREASVSAGGDTRILGDRRGQPWVVGVQHPRDTKKMAVRLPLSDTAISTSGDYERFFVQDGVRYHHIIDPTSGSSAAGSMSVTILGPSGIFTDALSTSVFVLGAAKGMALINQMPGIDGIIIDAAGNMTYSDELVPPTAAP
ncbi:MAG: FAD:protein FMN transferase [Pseudomonadales bacterium]